MLYDNRLNNGRIGCILLKDREIVTATTNDGSFLANLTTQKALYHINRMTAVITTKVQYCLNCGKHMTT
jgi:hypothetical protein